MKELFEMNIDELMEERNELLNEDWDYDWQYQFTKAEIKEVIAYIHKKIIPLS